MGNNRLYDGGKREAKNERPQYFPSHGESHAERPKDGIRDQHRVSTAVAISSGAADITAGIISLNMAHLTGWLRNNSRCSCSFGLGGRQNAGPVRGDRYCCEFHNAEK
jgi:hypothetical protein